MAANRCKLRPNKKIRSDSGQTAVEYILLLALVAGAAVIFKNALVDNIVDDVDKAKAMAETKAWKGGVNDLRLHYRNGCGKSNLCR